MFRVFSGDENFILSGFLFLCFSPGRGASGGHTPASVRSQSPSAGSSHSSSGGDVKPAFSIGTSSPKEEPLRYR